MVWKISSHLGFEENPSSGTPEYDKYGPSLRYAYYVPDNASKAAALFQEINIAQLLHKNNTSTFSVAIVGKTVTLRVFQERLNKLNFTDPKLTDAYKDVPAELTLEGDADKVATFLIFAAMFDNSINGPNIRPTKVSDTMIALIRRAASHLPAQMSEEESKAEKLRIANLLCAPRRQRHITAPGPNTVHTMPALTNALAAVPTITSSSSSSSNDDDAAYSPRVKRQHMSLSDS